MSAIDLGQRHFACTQCGACCDRSPEVELSEAAALADVFVFRLLFRLYSMPQKPRRELSETAASFYERKRLMALHAARVDGSKRNAGTAVETRTSFLMISALAVSTTPRGCSALAGSACSIYERRPLACRTVPFHYSRGDTIALRDFDTFVSSAGYCCDVSERAPVVLSAGNIVDEQVLRARATAATVADQDRLWKHAIVNASKNPKGGSLPSLRDIEDAAGAHALTTSMRIGWEVAANAAIMRHDEVRDLVKTQLSTIEHALQTQSVSLSERQTLLEMHAEYRDSLAA